MKTEKPSAQTHHQITEKGKLKAKAHREEAASDRQLSLTDPPPNSIREINILLRKESNPEYVVYVSDSTEKASRTQETERPVLGELKKWLRRDTVCVVTSKGRGDKAPFSPSTHTTDIKSKLCSTETLLYTRSTVTFMPPQERLSKDQLPNVKVTECFAFTVLAVLP
ncbi:hypothetical protein STEG23_005408 [Scotinomys teguina]